MKNTNPSFKFKLMGLFETSGNGPLGILVAALIAITTMLFVVYLSS